MAALALAWWGSLLADAAMGRAAWSSPLLGAVLLLAWTAGSFRGMARRARVLSYADAGSQPMLYWQDATASWQDAAGAPVSLRVVFDLGRFCLLKRVPTGEPGVPCHASFHWIEASRGAGHLHGPWRWRVMMASSRSSTPPTIALPNQFPRHAGRPA
ncbi:MAG: hypothetical protein EOP40_01930 [Rubrivivax sp.]|nr:MAG: hypothetical protein EOP40_01930 [Rubrivivax sp.]